jgi:hypothetical protein
MSSASFRPENGKPLPISVRLETTSEAAPPVADLAFGPVIERLVRNREAVDFDSGKLALMPAAELDPEKGLLWVLEQRLASVTGWMSQQQMDALSDASALTAFGLQVNALTNADWDGMNPSQLGEIMKTDWKKTDRSRFVEVIHPINDREQPHAILGLRNGTSRTFAFRTREGGLGILQIFGATGDGVRLRYKLVQDGAAKATAVEKSATADAKPTFGPVMERVLPSGVPCREQYFQFRSGEVFVVGNGPGTSKEEAAYDEKRIEEAGGADMSASSSENQIHIAGRGCIFTRDFWDKLKWDSFSAEQAVSAIKRARDVDGVVTPTRKELPIIYLFKTANGEVGLMEVLGVVENQRNGWNENGMKFRYKLVQGTGTANAAATTKSSLVFGPETQGLQAALEVTPGEPFKLRITFAMRPIAASPSAANCIGRTTNAFSRMRKTNPCQSRN